jgi:phosphatidylglycerol:prolipoprotein diacylglycerol transferase
MLPVLLDLKFIKIYTFGVFLVLAFFWGSFLLWKLIRLTSFREEDIFDGLFWILGGGLFFARLFYVLLNFKDFGFNFLKFILINGYPGLSFYGALAGGTVTALLFFSSKKIKFSEVIDYFIPSLFLSLGFGKLGSFFSGAEVGTKTKIFLAVNYVGFDGARHLTAFYEALLFFLAAYLSYKLVFEVRKQSLKQGFNLFFLIWFFSLTYLVFDKLKFAHLYLGNRSFNEIVSALLFLTTTGYFLYYFKSLIKDKLKIINYDIKKLYQKTKRKIGKRIGKDSRSD